MFTYAVILKKEERKKNHFFLINLIYVHGFLIGSKSRAYRIINYCDAAGLEWVWCWILSPNFTFLGHQLEEGELLKAEQHQDSIREL